MKKILLFASVALMFAGCAKENVTPSDGDDNNNQKGELTLSFTASQNGFGTKAVIGDTTTDGEGHKSTAINWQSTDQISVFDGKGVNCAFDTKDFNAETPTNCTFQGNVTALATDYTAVYPYTGTATIAEGVISGITLPATQTAVEGSFDTKAALMAAKTVGGGRDLSFQNLVGYVKVATDFDCTKIELTAASGEALAGAGSITFDAEGTPSFALATEGTATAITLEGTIAAGKTYYIAVPAQTLEAGWSISFTATEGKVYKRKAAKQIIFKKNTVINLGTVKQEDFLPYVTFSAMSEQTFTMNFQPYSDVAAFELGDQEYFEYRVGYGDWNRSTTTISEIPFGGSLGDLQLRGVSSQGTAVSNDTKYTIISFGSNVQVSCSGDIRTLVDYKNYETANTINARFCNLFSKCSQLTSAPELPAETLATKCYFNMFYACESLTAAPVLPATILAESCYASMFHTCSALTTAPELKATTLATSCYSAMFCHCDALTTAPALPATELADYCYESMFSDCDALTTAPALPAKTLAPSCYQSMFNSCKNLKSAPALPATTLAVECYQWMFKSCKALETAPALPATTLADYCYNEMFLKCTSLTETPVLPDAKLASDCYCGMFAQCSDLREVRIKTKPVFTDEDEKYEYPSYFVEWLLGCSIKDFYCTKELYDFNKTIPESDFLIIPYVYYGCYNIDAEYPEDNPLY